MRRLMHAVQDNASLIAVTQQHVTCSMEKILPSNRILQRAQISPDVKAFCPDSSNPSDKLFIQLQNP